MRRINKVVVDINLKLIHQFNRKNSVKVFCGTPAKLTVSFNVFLEF